MRMKFPLICFFLLLIIFSLFSYSLTHPSLVLLGWQPYWNFQTWMWKTFYNNRQLLAYSYVGIVSLLFATYLWILRTGERTKLKISWRQAAVAFAVIITPLIFSYNALSSDVFNYIFNAKMVLVYKANPHTVAAQLYSYDPWTRFMTNTYSWAPYGYGWTAISLLPYPLGLGKFLPTWLIYRLFSVLSLGLLFLTYLYFSKHFQKEKFSLYDAALIFLHPLILIEIISNSHNDIWMMWMAILSLGMMLKKDRKWWHILLSAVLLGTSTTIKLGTMMLEPIWLALLIRPWIKIPAKNKLISTGLRLWDEHWPTLASMAMLIPLMTPRSRQFHAWYLTWVMVWLPFIKFKPWKYMVLWFSFFTMLRYVPWLLTDQFGDAIEFQQKMINWIPFILFPFLYGMWFLLTQKKKAKK